MIKNKILICTLLVICFFYSYSALNVAPIITTSYGKISGIADTNANMYLGIPFASPPVDNLRWKDTVDAKSWTPSILDGSNFKPSCPQLGCSPKAGCPNEV